MHQEQIEIIKDKISHGFSGTESYFFKIEYERNKEFGRKTLQELSERAQGAKYFQECINRLQKLQPDRIYIALYKSKGSKIPIFEDSIEINPIQLNEGELNGIEGNAGTGLAGLLQASKMETELKFVNRENEDLREKTRIQDDRIERLTEQIEQYKDLKREFEDKIRDLERSSKIGDKLIDGIGDGLGALVQILNPQAKAIESTGFAGNEVEEDPNDNAFTPAYDFELEPQKQAQQIADEIYAWMMQLIDSSKENAHANMVKVFQVVNHFSADFNKINEITDLLQPENTNEDA